MFKAKQVFQELRSQGVSRSKALMVSAKAAAVVGACSAAPAFAVVADDTAIGAGMDATKTTVILIVGALVGIALVIAGVGIVLKLLNK